MAGQSLYHTFHRYKTLYTDKITALPIVILMPHSACNCRCVMCDIWKDNKNLKQLTEADVTGLLSSLKQLGTKQVLMSGGEALLNPNFFRFCKILEETGVSVTLLSTGLTLKKNAGDIVKHVHDVIISLDGDEQLHDAIRNIPGAFNKIREGIQALKALNPNYRITGRTVIHRLNFHAWPAIVKSAHAIGLDQISFLPADVSSEAFNRETPWEAPRQEEVMIPKEGLSELNAIISQLVAEHKNDFETRFIAESPTKIQNILGYYSALHGLNAFPYKRCNAPWVSVVVEADGSVRPCFFHKTIGNIRQQSLSHIINSTDAIAFRKNLDMDKDSTCVKCVCYLNLPPRFNPAGV